MSLKVPVCEFQMGSDASQARALTTDQGSILKIEQKLLEKKVYCVHSQGLFATKDKISEDDYVCRDLLTVLPMYLQANQAQKQELGKYLAAWKQVQKACGKGANEDEDTIIQRLPLPKTNAFSSVLPQGDESQQKQTQRPQVLQDFASILNGGVSKTLQDLDESLNQSSYLKVVEIYDKYANKSESSQAFKKDENGKYSTRTENRDEMENDETRLHNVRRYPAADNPTDQLWKQSQAKLDRDYIVRFLDDKYPIMIVGNKPTSFNYVPESHPAYPYMDIFARAARFIHGVKIQFTERGPWKQKKDAFRASNPPANWKSLAEQAAEQNKRISIVIKDESIVIDEVENADLTKAWQDLLQFHKETLQDVREKNVDLFEVIFKDEKYKTADGSWKKKEEQKSSFKPQKANTRKGILIMVTWDENYRNEEFKRLCPDSEAAPPPPPSGDAAAALPPPIAGAPQPPPPPIAGAPQPPPPPPIAGAPQPPPPPIPSGGPTPKPIDPFPIHTIIFRYEVVDSDSNATCKMYDQKDYGILASGLDWKRAMTSSSKSIPLQNPALVELLKERTKLTPEEWNATGIDYLKANHIVKIDNDTMYEPSLITTQTEKKAEDPKQAHLRKLRETPQIQAIINDDENVELDEDVIEKYKDDAGKIAELVRKYNQVSFNDEDVSQAALAKNLTQQKLKTYLERITSISKEGKNVSWSWSQLWSSVSDDAYYKEHTRELHAINTRTQAQALASAAAMEQETIEKQAAAAVTEKQKEHIRTLKSTQKVTETEAEALNAYVTDKEIFKKNDAEYKETVKTLFEEASKKNVDRKLVDDPSVKGYIERINAMKKPLDVIDTIRQILDGSDDIHFHKISAETLQGIKTSMQNTRTFTLTPKQTGDENNAQNNALISAVAAAVAGTGGTATAALPGGGTADAGATDGAVATLDNPMQYFKKKKWFLDLEESADVGQSIIKVMFNR